jgi:hypothetical protein
MNKKQVSHPTLLWLPISDGACNHGWTLGMDRHVLVVLKNEAGKFHRISAHDMS